ncbi:MAG: hypothetical protein ACRD5K_08540 [Candidatus Acidiferrales bacterium]
MKRTRIIKKPTISDDDPVPPENSPTHTSRALAENTHWTRLTIFPGYITD